MDALQLPRIPTWQRATLVHALRHAWCYPRDPNLEERARLLGVNRPEPPSTGSTALVTVSEGSQRTSLYSFGPLDVISRSGNTVPLVGTSARSLELSQAVIARHLGAFKPGLLPTRLRWAASLVARDGDGVDAVLDGPSLGLGVALAIASVFLDRSVPQNMLASAEVASDGTIGPVGGLEEKLQFIAGSVLGVNEVLVAAEQAAEAETLVASLRRPLSVRSVRHVREALQAAFGFVSEPRALVSYFADVGDARRAAHHLFDHVLSGVPASLDWDLVTPIASAIRQRLEAEEGEGDAASRAVFVESVWRRHSGQVSAIEWPTEAWLTHLPRPRRLRVAAQAVQSAADSDDVLTQEYIRRATPLLAAPSEATEVDWILSGAMGRALAAIGDYEGAAVRLDAALDGWLSIAAHSELSLPLSERARVAALLGDEPTLRRLARDVAPLVLESQEIHPVSRAYVRIALARALLFTGRPESALGELTGEDIDWATLPLALAHVRARFMALVHTAMGDEKRAAAVLTELAAKGTAGRADEQLLLFRLGDVSQAAATDALAELVSHWRIGPEIRRLVARHTSHLDAAERPAAVLRHFRY